MSDYNDLLYEYDMGSCEWKVIPTSKPINNFYLGFKSLVYGKDHCMLIGGFVQSKSGKTEYKLVRSVNLRSGEIKTLKPITSSRRYFSAIHFNGEIFVFGGRDANYCNLPSVEK